MSLHGIDTTNWRFSRQQIAGTIQTPDEVTLAYIDAPPTGTYASSPRGTILLIHGFPQTSHQFRHVINPLAVGGYRIIVPDYRGAGESSKPVLGYEKTTMAADLHDLLFKHLQIKSKVHVIGHDIGGMIAHAFAARFPDSTASVVWGECPLPGTQVYEDAKFTPPMFHFSFHWQMDLPELLVTGKERQYLKHFYNRLSINHNFLSEADWEHYASMYAQPGGLRCGFNCYRGFHKDVEENKDWLSKQGKCKVPMLSLSGAGSALGGERAQKQSEEMYEKVRVEDVEGAGHWIAEENPKGFVDRVLVFVRKHT